MKLTQAMLLLALLTVQTAGAATIPVTNTADSGPGTLRVALASAADGDTIDATGISGTILLTSGELLVARSMTITGPGPANLAVNGNAASRAFNISGTVVTIAGLTITNGKVSGGYPANAGGGIYNDHGTLTVSNCALSGNSAPYGGGAIYNNGEFGSATLTVSASTLSGNSASGSGGGIYNNGAFGNATLTVSASTLSGNSASTFGGGTYNNGAFGSATLTVSASTLNGNSAGSGGGLYNDGYSGSATLTLSASTLSSNSAGGGGGIYNTAQSSGTGTVRIGSTILKAGASGGNIANLSGTVSSDGYNLASDNGAGLLTATADQINTDPMLGPLQDNGGPTFTHALLPGSPAIDKGKNFSGLTTDQRGFRRTNDDLSIPNAPGGDGTDIGAFEFQKIIQLAIARDGSGGLFLRFTGAPDVTYRLQRAASVTGPWSDLATNTAPASGLIEYHETSPPPGRAFYRTVQP